MAGDDQDRLQMLHQQPRPLVAHRVVAQAPAPTLKLGGVPLGDDPGRPLVEHQHVRTRLVQEELHVRLPEIGILLGRHLALPVRGGKQFGELLGVEDAGQGAHPHPVDGAGEGPTEIRAIVTEGETVRMLFEKSDGFVVAADKIDRPRQGQFPRPDSREIAQLPVAGGRGHGLQVFRVPDGLKVTRLQDEIHRPAQAGLGVPQQGHQLAVAAVHIAGAGEDHRSPGGAGRGWRCLKMAARDHRSPSPTG